MASTINLKAVGLNTSPNQLELQDGSLLEASNVIIRSDNVIESRRGYKLFGESFGSSSDRAKQLAVYKGRILRHYSSTLQFQNGNVNTITNEAEFDSFSGSYSETQAGLRMKFLELNKNLYFTTSDGIKKISAASASEFSTASGYITSAGGTKALDFTASPIYTYGSQTDFFTEDSVVAYRIVWGKKDANNNLILGTPSERIEIRNPITNLMLQDFMTLLNALDYLSASGSLINDQNYVATLQLTASSSADDLLTNLTALTSKLDNDIVIANTAGTDGAATCLAITSANVPTNGTLRINVTGTPSNFLSVGSKVILSGFTSTGVTVNVAASVSAVAAGYFEVGITGTLVADVIGTGAGVVNYNEYRSITVPATPSVPATAQQLTNIQTYLNSIIQQLQIEPVGIIDATSLSNYIIPLDITTSSTVKLVINIPSSVTTSDFFQIYRTETLQATGTDVLADLSAGDEMGQVYEAFPTSAEISAGEITVIDETPDSFRGTNLYTNPSTGEGILQANDVPPFAKDINKFKNVMFFANTKTRHRKLLSLLGVVNMISDYDLGTTPKIVISNGVVSNTYSFVTGLPEITDITFTNEASFTGTTRRYFDIYSANDETAYRVVYQSPTMTSDPTLTGKTVIRVVLIGGETANQVAQKTRNKLNQYLNDFLATDNTLPTIRITNVEDGYTTNASVGTLPGGSSVTIFQNGRGENSSNKEVLLSSEASVAVSVEETARSLVRVINDNSSEIINAFYLSGTSDVPGKMLFEAKSLSSTNTPFYILGNNSNTGESFSPDISPEITISSNSIANPTVITTSTAHGLINQDYVTIVGSNSTPSIDGVHQITYISSTTFSIDVNVTVGGTSGALIKSVNGEFSENEEKVNRIYYSKLQQPEAVPTLNYTDVGAGDAEILRIFPLRDSLFVFKEDGLYRLSGEVAPFTVSLFDESSSLQVPDSLGLNDNTIYGYANSGLVTVSEAGVTVLSRAIDNTILPLNIPDYTNFKTASWGLGYESDSSYVFYTVSSFDDEVATIGYRFSSLTNNWTTFNKSVTCGVINPSDDKMYLGAGDTNYIEQERKSFSREDYADREFEVDLVAGNYDGNEIRLLNPDNVEIGDVIVQSQTLTVSAYNNLLKKLDLDPSITSDDYYSSLAISGGDDPRTALTDLATKLDSDPNVSSTDYLSTIASKSGSVTANTADNPTVITSTGHGLFTGRVISITGSNSTPSINGNYEVTVLSANTFSIDVNVTSPGTAGSWSTLDDNFNDILACYNKIIEKLNADSGLAFTNYMDIDHTTIQEAIVESIDSVTKVITLNLTLPYLLGPLTVYKSIPTVVTYGPQTFGDSLSLKQVREATLMFKNRAFTSATLSFASDLIPQFYDVNFDMDSNGIFGHQGFGTGFFGGLSNSAPFRTYIPRFVQRCRYIVPKFTHSIAREKYQILGLTLTAEVQQSTRAFR